MNDGNIRQRLHSSLRGAMKARDSNALRALRSTLAAIANAEAVEDTPSVRASAGPFAGAVDGLGAGEVPRRELTEAEVLAIVAREVADRRFAAAEYDTLGQADAAADLRAEATVLERHLTSA